MSSDPDAMRRDVERERERLNATIEEVERRLTPGQLVDEILRHARGPGSDLVTSIGRTLSANPIPTALVGVGLAWLLLTRATVPARTESAAPPPEKGTGA